MSSSTQRRELSRTSVLAAVLLVTISTLQPAAADDDLAADVTASDEAAEHVYLDDNDQGESDVASSGPSDGQCGESVENSRC